jgi:hypothetical protein
MIQRVSIPGEEGSLRVRLLAGHGIFMLKIVVLEQSNIVSAVSANIGGLAFTAALPVSSSG